LYDKRRKPERWWCEDQNTGMRRFESDWDTRLSPEENAQQDMYIFAVIQLKRLFQPSDEALLSAAKRRPSVGCSYLLAN
jgi:hypothetical protein